MWQLPNIAANGWGCDQFGRTEPRFHHAILRPAASRPARLTHSAQIGYTPCCMQALCSNQTS